MAGAGSGNQNLVGSTFAANYAIHLKLFNYMQTLAYIPAYNDFSAYSANETNTLGLSHVQEPQLFRGHPGQLPERSAHSGAQPDPAAHQAELVPVHDGLYLCNQIEILRLNNHDGASLSRSALRYVTPASNCQ